LAWLKQRIREATPFGSGPRFLVHDNDGIFGQFGRRRPARSGKSYRSALDLWLGEVLGIKGVPIPYGAPNAAAYIAYYNGERPHQGIDGIPEFGPGCPRATPQETGEGPIKTVARPVLGGLHHDYRIAA
jgi:hypothetical protein